MINPKTIKHIPKVLFVLLIFLESIDFDKVIRFNPENTWISPENKITVSMETTF